MYIQGVPPNMTVDKRLEGRPLFVKCLAAFILELNIVETKMTKCGLPFLFIVVLF